MSQGRTGELVRWTVIWTCLAANAFNLWLLLSARTPLWINTLVLIGSFGPYLIYVRYRTPPV